MIDQINLVDPLSFIPHSPKRFHLFLGRLYHNLNKPFKTCNGLFVLFHRFGGFSSCVEDIFNDHAECLPVGFHAGEEFGVVLGKTHADDHHELALHLSVEV